MKKKSRKILEHLDNVIKQSQNNIIFFGTVGAGKTTLVNKICNTDFKTLNFGDSCTRDIQYAFSIIHNMVIIDFPGLKSTENIMSHLQIQKTAIQNIPVKMICFVIELFDRIGPIKKEIDEMLKIFENYKNNITIIITKTDLKKFNDKRKEIIEKDINKFFKIKNVIFSHEKSNGYIICEELNKIQNTMQNIKYMSIKTSSIVETMNYYTIPEIEVKREFYENKFNNILNDHINESKKHKESDLKLAIFFCFKNAKRHLLEEYGKAAIMQFDGLIHNKFEDFRKDIENFIEVKINNYTNEYNKFKKCPYCGQIWFKIIGCDHMVCGNRTTLLDKICGRWKSYKVSYNYERRSFTISSNEHEDRYRGGELTSVGLTPEEKNINAKRKLEGKAEIKPIGCGNKLDWAQMEDCTEKVLKILKENSLENDYYTDSFDYYDKLKKNK